MGYDEGGRAYGESKTPPLLRCNFDEIEKAHPDVHNLLLQVMDDGILTDSNGGKVNFKNTIVIMTSNVGTRQLKSTLALVSHFKDADADSSSLSEQVIQKSLKKTFAPGVPKPY